ncbi:MFS transporter [Massilia sp. NR 4-1]|uniref:MFS transporter n=1 Tax=Massilia sp. NR 4-1 TaxID=1678028 RepID=UPI0009E2F3C3|nr:MFS transporter [Massilia sp. NR 4-1]
MSQPDMQTSAGNGPSAADASGAAQSGRLGFVLVSIFIDMLGLGLVVPVLPLLVGEFVPVRDQQALWYGIMGAIFGLMQFFCMPILGALSDRVGRRPVLLYSMAGMGLSFLITAWAPSLAWLLLARVVGGMSSASMAVASAYASDISTPENRAKSFGKIGASFGLGFICGPMLGGLLGDVSLHLPFVIAAALSAANFIYGWFFVPESLPAERRGKFNPSKLNPLAGLARLGRRRDIRGLLFAYGFMVLAQVGLHSTWVLYNHFRFGWNPTQNGISLFCVGLMAAVVQAGLLGMLIKRFGEVKLALMGLGSGFIVYMLYGMATQGWMMYVFIFCNLLAFTTGPAMQAIFSKSTPPAEQGELMGSLQSINAVGIICMPLIGSAILGEVSHLPAGDWRMGASFFMCAILQGLAIVVARRYFARSGLAFQANS